MAAALLAGAIAFTLQILWVRTFAVSVPYWDEWQGLVGFLERYTAGAIGWRDMFAQHMEHRIPVARLAFIFVYEVFGEASLLGCLVLNALLMGAIAAVFVYTLRRLDTPLWVVAASLVVLLSNSQFENMLWAFQVEFYTLVLPPVAGACYIALAPRISWAAIAALAAGCAISSYSIASGLMSWGVIGATLLLRMASEHRPVRAMLRARREWLQLAAFGAIAVAVAAAYLYDYQRLPPHAASARRLWPTFQWLLAAVVFPLVDPLQRAQTPWLPVVFMVVAAPIGFALRMYWREHDHARLVLSIGLLLMVGSNVALVAYGRGAFPFVASRYGTIVLWAGVVSVLSMADLLRAYRARPAKRWAVPLLATMLVAVVGAHVWRYTTFVGDMREHRRQRLIFERSVVSYVTDASGHRVLAASVPFPRRPGLGLLNDSRVVGVLPSNLRPRAAAHRSGEAWTFGGVPPSLVAPADQFIWGSWSGDGSKVGTLTTTPFTVRAPLVLRVGGYPSRSGNQLAIESSRDPSLRIVYSGPDPGERWEEWSIPGSALPDPLVNVVAVDGSREPDGWVAVGLPFDPPAAVRRLEAFVRRVELWMAPILLTLAWFALRRT
jgi:hypothetical protein